MSHKRPVRYSDEAMDHWINEEIVVKEYIQELSQLHRQKVWEVNQVADELNSFKRRLYVLKKKGNKNNVKPSRA